MATRTLRRVPLLSQNAPETRAVHEVWLRIPHGTWNQLEGLVRCTPPCSIARHVVALHGVRDRDVPRVSPRRVHRGPSRNAAAVVQFTGLLHEVHKFVYLDERHQLCLIKIRPDSKPVALVI